VELKCAGLLRRKESRGNDADVEEDERLEERDSLRRGGHADMRRGRARAMSE
jgi:hypothetical protein